MEHPEVTETMAVARYLLGEMNDDEKNAFAEHLFGCPVCAEEVKDGAVMIDSLRAERRAAQPAPSSRTAWWVAAAAAVAVLLLGYQNLTMRNRPVAHPRVIPSFSLLTIGSRGANETVIPDASNPFVLYLDIPPQANAQQYNIDIRNAGGATVARFPVSPQQARETVTVYVPGGLLVPGRYTLAVEGIQQNQKESEITSAPLVVRH